MKFSANLLINGFLLVTSSVFARPSGVARRIAQHQANKVERLIYSRDVSALNGTHPVKYSNWAGAELVPSGATYESVVGTFTVPLLSGVTSASTLSIWIGIDADGSSESTLQAGVDLTFGSTLSLEPWYEWYPNFAFEFSGISISPGEVIILTITASSSTAAIFSIENVTTGKTVSETLSSSVTLAGQTVEWAVEPFIDTSTGSLPPFVVSFTDASATTSSGSALGLGGATIVEIQDTYVFYLTNWKPYNPRDSDLQPLTDVTINSAGTSVTIDYL